jgi:hypothetical protein
LSITPTSSAAAPAGAAPPASGSQVWNGKNGALIANATKKPRNSQRAVFVSIPEADHRGQHEQAADQRVEEELDRRVLPARSTVRPDDEVHRDQHDLEEHVEQEHVGGREDADHRALEGQQQREVAGHRPPAVLDVVPGGQDHQRGEHRDQHQHDQGDAVRGEREPGVPARDPGVRLAELEPLATGLKGDPHDDAEHQHRQRPAERDDLRELLLGLRHDGHHHGTHQREHREDGQERETHASHPS